MNDWGMLNGVLDLALAEAQRARAARITALNIVLFDDGIISPERLQAQFEPLMRGTLAEDARVNVDYRASERHCWSCGTMFAGHGFDAECPQCGSPGLRVARAPEFYLDSVELEHKVAPATVASHVAGTDTHSMRSSAGRPRRSRS